MTKALETFALLGGTSPLSLYKGVPPPPGFSQTNQSLDTVPVTENKTEALFSFPQISFNPKSNECQQIHTFIATSLVPVVIEHVNYVEVSNKVIRVLT